MGANDTTGTARDIIGPLTDIARAMKAQHQALESGRLAGPKGDTGATGPAGAPGAPGAVSGLVLYPSNTDSDRTEPAETGTVFAVVAGTPNTITRSSGSFISAGRIAGQKLTMSGWATSGNNKTVHVVAVTASTLTLATTDSLTAESAGATVTFSVNRETWTRRPPTGAEVDESVTVSLRDGDVSGDSYCTVNLVPGVTVIPAGTWAFHDYCYVSSASATVSRVKFRVSVVHADGTETELFTTPSTIVTATSAASPQLVLNTYTYTSDTIIATTDRVQKTILWTNDSNSLPRTCHHLYAGSVHASWVQTPLSVAGVVTDWYAYDGASYAYQLPAHITNSRGIELLWNGSLGTVTIQTNFAVPAGPVPNWYATDAAYHYPEHVVTARGIEFLYDSGTGAVTVQTNFPVGDLVHNPEFTQDGTHRAHSLHFQGVAPHGGTTVFSFTEEQWKQTTQLPDIDTPNGIGIVSVTVQVVGRDPAGGAGYGFDWTFKGAIECNRSAGLGSWTVIGSGLVQMTGMSIGTASTLVCYMSLSGSNNGTIDVSISNPTQSGIPADFGVFIDIRGAGNYGAPP